MRIKIFFGILLSFLITAGVSFAVGAIPPTGGYTPELQEIDPDCSQGDTDCFVDLNHQGYTDTGTRVGADLTTVIGDYDNSSNGTKIEINDSTQETKLSQNRLLINTDSDALSDAVAASIYQKENGGGKSASEVNTFRDFIRNAVFSPSAGYYSQVVRLLDEANDDSTGGTITQNIINRKTGSGNLAFQYASNLVSEAHQGDIGFLVTQVVRNRILGTDPVNVTTIMRGVSTDVRVDNPNATVAIVQGLHPTVDLRQGTINGAQVVFLDFDIDPTNPNLNLDGDITYLQGGGGSDVVAAIPIVEANGHKFRFIWNQGTAESDFGGIINYTGDVSDINDATDKVLVNKEWFNLNNNKTPSYTVATLPTGMTGDMAHVTDAGTFVTYRAVATGGGPNAALVFFDGTNWLYH
jgi:hypothetical protein